MGIVWPAVTSQLSFINPITLLLIVIFSIAWMWATRNKVERLFLSKNIALINTLLVAILLFFVFTGLTLLSISSLPASSNSLVPNTTRLTILSYVYYGILFVFSLYDPAANSNNRFFNNSYVIKIGQFFKHKVIVTIFSLIIIALAVYLYHNYIRYSIQFYQPLINEDHPGISANTTNEIITFLFGVGFDSHSFNVFRPFIVFSLICFIAVGGPLAFMLRRIGIKESGEREMKVTVILKNGKKIEGVYLQNKSSGNYFHFQNNYHSPTQYAVVHKDEIERFLFNEYNHKDEDEIRQEF